MSKIYSEEEKLATYGLFELEVNEEIQTQKIIVKPTIFSIMILKNKKVLKSN